MIELTRLNGHTFAINADLIERIDVTPDTVLTLVDGSKYLVAESLDDVIDRIRAFRASIVACANQALDSLSPPGAPTLRIVAPEEG
jgi:flagellar protein FlbD